MIIDNAFNSLLLQGFEIVIEGRKYFAFSAYEKQGKNVTSHCGKTMPGWTHDVLDRNWACFQGEKTSPVPPKYHLAPEKYSAELVFFHFYISSSELKAQVSTSDYLVSAIYKLFTFFTSSQEPLGQYL